MRIRIGRRAAAVAVAAALWLAAPAAQAAPDLWITTKVKMALLSAEGVAGSKVNVDTVDGRVTLHGTVASDSAKALAEQEAREVEGVREVRNLLQVAPAGEPIAAADDERIREQVKTVLERDQALDDSKIEVTSVNDGVVLLSGTAASLSDHKRALEDAASVAGVRRVASQIESPDELADEEIWREGGEPPAESAGAAARDLWITSAAKMRLLLNEATPALQINVDTRDGVVTLFGMVPSQAASQAAAAEVAKIDGVKRVDNELQVVSASAEAAVQAEDDAIQDAVAKRLETREELKDAQIDVEVSNGVARLTGTVDTQSDRLTALTVARATSGVRSVSDALRLREQVGAR